MHTKPPTLIPQPHEFSWTAGSFGLNADTSLVLAAVASDATLFAARELQQMILEVCGFDARIAKGLHVEQRNTISLLVRGQADDHAVLPEDGDEGSPGEQGYHLVITAHGIVVTGADEAGLFYGVQTLKQLLRTQGRRLAACECTDAPVLLHRGIMLDVSRGKVPTRATLAQLAEVLAHYKLNQLQLYTEHTFRFPSHPLIGAEAGSLSADDMLALDQVCRARHIELVPNLQSTGHMRHILSLPAYEHLAETPWKWSLTPAREESYRLLDDLYGDLLPAFSVGILNVDSDETWDHGRGQAKELAGEGGYGRVYLNHILKLRELAARHGRQIMIWADVLHHYPELIRELPADVILLDWEYEGLESYPTLQTLARAGRPFYVCPGTSTWNTLFPRIDNSLANIRNYVRDGIAAGAIGMLNTDWGDMGHYQPLGHSWYSYLFGAEMAWTGATTATETFDEAFGRLFLGDASGIAVAAIRRLGQAVEQPGLGARNRSETIYALWEDPLAGRMVQAAPPEALAQMVAAGQAAIPAFALLPDALLRHELSFTAYQMIHVGQKVQLGQRVRTTLRDLATQPVAAADSLARLDELVAEMQRLRADVTPMVVEFERLWLARAQRSEIHLNLQRYAALLLRFDAALHWLREQRTAYANGGKLDAELATYEVGDHLVLWDEGHRDLKRLVELVGRDAVPPEILEWLVE